MDLVNKLWNFCHTLRHEGVDYSDYIEELTYLLFLKIADEKSITIPEGCSWINLTESNEADLLRQYNAILRELSNQQGILKDIFSEPIAKIHNSQSLKKLLNLIDEVNWSSYNQDVLGTTFEGLLERAASESKKGAGQYFTPRPLIQSIVRVTKPNPLESEDFKISDIACGTAGFLTESFEWFKSEQDLNTLNKDQLSKVVNRTYFGQELVIRPRRLALMNLYLHGLSPIITLGDTIYEPLPANYMACSCILTNPPFGTRGADQIPDRGFVVKTSNKQLNFIQHAFEILKTGGRAAIVLPDSVLFEGKAKELWEYIMQNCNVHTILKLPNGTFVPYADVKANVVFFQKGLPTKNTWIFDSRTNVENVTKRSRPLTIQHFTEFIDSFGVDPNGLGERKESARFKSFSIDDIKIRNYNLDINWIKEESLDESKVVGTSDLTYEVIGELEAIVEDLKDIIQQLEE